MKLSDLRKIRLDALAVSVMIFLPLVGIITVDDALAGFSDPNVILIAAMFVIGEGIVRTGIANRVSDFLVDRAGESETKLLVMLMFTVAGLGAFMSSTGIVAIFIPVVLALSVRLRTAAGRLMMPLSFAGLMSGMQTLVATPPNLIVDSALKREGVDGFSFFSFTPIGLTVLVAGIIYMLIARRWLAIRSDDDDAVSRRPTIQTLVDEYQLSDHAHMLHVSRHSPLIGKTVRDTELRKKYQVNIVAIHRNLLFHSELISPRPSTVIRADDRLLVDIMPGKDYTEDMRRELKLDEHELSAAHLHNHSREVGMIEVLVPPGSDLLQKSIREVKFRKKFRLSVAGLRRQGKPFDGDYLDTKIQLGDTLLLIGSWKAINRIRKETQNFITLTLPVEVELAAPETSRAPFALLSLAVMVVLMVGNIVPNVLAALVACMIMGIFGCINMTQAYKSIHWESLLVIVGMMPLAIALEKTGGLAWGVSKFVGVIGDAPSWAVLGGLFLFTSIFGMFISNTATAVIMAPVAISIANQLGVSPRPFAMIIALSASASFMTPISSPVNMLVMGPGRYQFFDFVKIGVPFTLIVLVISVLLVPIFFPL